MAGLKITLPGSFTDTSLPKIADDAILTAGSLVLFDAIHSANPMAAGVPANGASIPNIAWKEAAAAIGSGSQSSLAGAFDLPNAGSDYLYERSGKGGLHAIYSQVTNAATRGGALKIPDAVATFLIANSTHKYYFSMWHYMTRAGITDASGDLEAALSGIFKNGAVAQQIELMNIGAGNANTENLGRRNSPGPNTVGPTMRNIAVNGWHLAGGSLPADAASMNKGAVHFGNYNGFGSVSQNQCPSHIHYRFYLEDLTVSGRTYAAVDALDYSLYQAAVTTAGGRYYGDTYTAPSTLP